MVLVRNTLKTLAALAAAISLAPLSTATAAMRNVYLSLSGPEVQAFLKAKGYSAELVTDDTGDPELKSASSGYKFAVFFSGCDKAAVRSCQYMKFISFFTDTPSYELANTCNDKTFSGRLVRYKDSVTIEYTVPVSGIDDEFLSNALDAWNYILPTLASCVVSGGK